MDKEKIRQMLLEQNKLHANDIIKRAIKKKILNYSDDPFIIIITGIRRSGKSTILFDLKNDFKNAYYVNFDDDRLINFKVEDFQVLYELLIELFGDRKIFLFDEIQNVVGWERFVRRLHNNRKKVYITGSNATMLSKELGTHLTGRHIAFSLFPFSFKEFLTFNKHKINNLTTSEKSKLKRLFNQYLKKGGFPEYLKTEKKEYLKFVYENILYKDIITRYNIKNEKALKEVVYFAISNIGKEISFNQLKKLTGLTSATTVKEYFSYLENAFLLFLIPRYDSSLKKQIYYNKKVYLIDTDFVDILGFRTSKDYGRLLENLVFIELKRRNKEIYFHKNNKECDFVIKKANKIIKAIQVTKELNDKNQEREIQGLLEAMKIHKLKTGLILTDDQEKEFRIKKKRIIVKPIWKWLIED